MGEYYKINMTFIGEMTKKKKLHKKIKKQDWEILFIRKTDEVFYLFLSRYSA